MPDSKINSEKAQMLLAAGLKAVPGATASDVERQTAIGQRLISAIENAAQKLFADSNDQEWLAAAKELRARRLKTKPMRSWNTK